MAKKNYYPVDESGFIQWCIDFFLYLEPKLSAWGLSAVEESSLRSAFDAFQAAYNLYHNPEHQTPSNRVAKDGANEALQKQLRAYVREHLAFNHFVSDADRRALGITVRNQGPRTPHPVPESIPILSFVPQISAWIYMYIIDSVSKRRAKPFGVQGAEYRFGIYDIRDTLPVNAEDLPGVNFITRWPYIFKFGKENRGKQLCVCARWENTRGEKGAWSEIYCVIIS